MVFNIRLQSGAVMTRPLRIVVKTTRRLVLLQCRGAIELGPSAELFLATVRAHLRGERAVALDLRRVTRMDARGIGALAELVSAGRTAGRRLILAGASSHVRSLVTLAGLDGALHRADPSPKPNGFGAAA